MAAPTPQPHWNVIFRLWKLFFGEYMVPIKIKTPMPGVYVDGWEHSRYFLGWGNPDGTWRVLFYLPF